MSKLEQFIARFPWVRSNAIPFAKLTKDLADCKIALVSTGGVYAPSDMPFNIIGSADVDESHREISYAVPLQDLKIAHEHFNKAFSAQDMNVIYPIERLQTLVEEFYIGGVAEINYSISGYIPNPDKLFQTGKTIATSMLAQGVDIAVIVPV
ncbi:MAG: hypothetical protein KGZ50_12290 [Peptococcaceae bacterium]|nr:hypothetical protein [Peptococcaceae bacterium]